MQNYRNELCKSYDIDTNETFIVTRRNDKTLNIVTFVQSVHPSPPTSTKTATSLINCIVNDGLVDTVANVHQTLLEFVNIVHP